MVDDACSRLPTCVSGSGSWQLRKLAFVGSASDRLKPYDARLMQCYPVRTRINHVANDDEECSAPVELTQIQDRLFS
jgi:hypothetical protein